VIVEFGWIMPIVLYAFLLVVGVDPHRFLTPIIVMEAVSLSAYAWEMHVRWRDRDGAR
jgi:hypothetical protein